MTSVIVCGAYGRMGQEISDILEKDKKTKIVAKVDITAKGKSEYKSVDQVKNSKADVLIEFTIASEFEKILDWCAKNKIPLVSGTTGISSHQKKKMAEVAKTIPVFWSPNMSVGVNFVSELLSHYSKISNFDFEITETHHSKKKDKPSGTALLLKDALEAAIKRKIPNPCSLRIGGIFGVHQVNAASENEEIILEHRALNRRVFAQGAVEAAKWMVNKPAGLYSMRDLIMDL